MSSGTKPSAEPKSSRAQRTVWSAALMVTALFFFGCAQSGDSPVVGLFDASMADAGRTDDGGINGPGDAGVDLLTSSTPEECGSCHPTHYEEWRSSMHAYATRDPIFLALNKKGVEETEGRLDQFCVQCHAPAASQRGLLQVVENDGRFEMPIDLDNPLIANGVQCTSCHNVEAVEATQNARIVYSSSSHFGPTGNAAANEAHPVEGSPLFADTFQKNLLCGSCHDFVNPNGVRLDSTFSTWYANEYNDPGNALKHRTCQDCHMPTSTGRITDDGPETVVHSHYFVGVYQALLPGFPGRAEMARLAQALLSDCAELDLRFNGIDEEDNAAVVVSVRNINNGHSLPAGSTADTQVWVHLQIYDGEGNLVLESGMPDENGDLMDGIEGRSLDPDGDPELMLFGQLIFGQEGQHVTFPWQAHTFTENLIAPGQRKWRDFLVPMDSIVGDEIRVVASLNYRTFPPFMLRTLIAEGYLDPDEIDPVPIIEMESIERIFNLR